ncbi:translation initiation factor eIF4e [Flagelloscypha sp. PMI_526]|nr:translation initiation factor eIF4e [Flagelloscypha sp. PMI_526]
MSSKNRLPSLNQLAARINSQSSDSSASPDGGSPSGDKSLKDPTAGANAAPNRPRLAAFALRTTSSLSVERSSSVDSAKGGDESKDEEVSSATTATSTTSKNRDESPSATPLSSTSSTQKYKNIPSLDAITARLARQRTLSSSMLSVDGTEEPPAPPMREIEDPKTPGLMTKIPIPEHPLQFEWTIYFDSKVKYPYTPAPGTEAAAPAAVDTDDYEAGLTVVGNFKTVETFCRYFNWLKPPSHLPKNSNYHLFKKGIKPMWEDPANQEGGKWVLTMRNQPQLLDRCWSYLSMALVGQEIEEDGDEICGAVVSVRGKVDRIQLWTRTKTDIEKLNSIGKKLVSLLDVSEADAIGLEFQYNTDDRPPPNKFISISSMPGTALPGGRFGAGISSPMTPHAPSGLANIRGDRDGGGGALEVPNTHGGGGRPTSGGTSLGTGGGGGGGGSGAFGSFGMGSIGSSSGGGAGGGGGGGGGGSGWRKAGR